MQYKRLRVSHTQAHLFKLICVEEARVGNAVVQPHLQPLLTLLQLHNAATARQLQSHQHKKHKMVR